MVHNSNGIIGTALFLEGAMNWMGKVKSRRPCPENNRKDAKNAEQASKDLCALGVFAVAFTRCGAASGMRIFQEEGATLLSPMSAP